jgi:hypothetical protein
MKSGSHLSLVETAENSSSVNPKENGWPGVLMESSYRMWMFFTVIWRLSNIWHSGQRPSVRPSALCFLLPWWSNLQQSSGSFAAPLATFRHLSVLAAIQRFAAFPFSSYTVAAALLPRYTVKLIISNSGRMHKRHFH